MLFWKGNIHNSKKFLGQQYMKLINLLYYCITYELKLFITYLALSSWFSPTNQNGDSGKNNIMIANRVGATIAI